MRSHAGLLHELNDFLSSIGIDHAVCGGHAIDLFVGRRTRAHKDLDVAVYWEDRDSIIERMLGLGWMVLEPVGTGHLHRITDAKDQKRVKSNIWCILPGNQRYRLTEQDGGMFAVRQDETEQTGLDFIEFLFNTQKDDRFLYARNHDVGRAMNKAVRWNDGIAYLAPELVLLYKSTTPGNLDCQCDFDIAYPLLSADSRHWLRSALMAMNPGGHDWLKRIEGNP